MSPSLQPITLERQTSTGLHRFVVTFDRRGWLLREEQEEEVVRQVTCDDWHRVERAMRRFARHSTKR